MQQDFPARTGRTVRAEHSRDQRSRTRPDPVPLPGLAGAPGRRPRRCAGTARTEFITCQPPPCPRSRDGAASCRPCRSRIWRGRSTRGRSRPGGTGRRHCDRRRSWRSSWRTCGAPGPRAGVGGRARRRHRLSGRRHCCSGARPRRGFSGSWPGPGSGSPSSPWASWPSGRSCASGTRAGAGAGGHLDRRAPGYPLDARIARLWGELAGQAQLRRRPRPPNHTWIAACCLRYRLPLVALHPADFGDFGGSASRCSATGL